MNIAENGILSAEKPTEKKCLPTKLETGKLKS